MTDLPPVDIQWEAPAPCPTLGSVQSAIERLLGKRLDALQGVNVHAEAEAQQKPDGNWQLQVRLSVGERIEEDTLVAKRCQALGDAMALKVALAIDPLAVVDAVQPPQPPEPAAAPPPVNVAPKPRRAEATHENRFALRVVGGVGLGPLPGVTPGAGLFGSLQLHAFRVELGGQAYWGGSVRYAEPNSVGADLRVFMGAARACVTPGNARFIFPICGGLELGAMRGRGFGVAATDTTTGVWGGVVIGPALQFRATSRLSVWVEADASLTVLKPEFHMRNLGTLYSPPAGGSRAQAGLEVNF